MAENVLEDEISCPVCLTTYRDPVLMGCGHCYCRQCITDTLCHQRDEGKSYTCPMCQAQYQDFPALLSNLQLSSIVDSYVSMQQSTEECHIPCGDCLDNPSMAVKTCASCEVSLCNKHVERHRKKEHILLEPIASVQDRKCPEHDKLLEYYCEQDSSCICVTCYIAGGHKGHDIMTLKQAHEKQLATLSTTTSTLSASVSEFCKHIKDLNDGLVKIKENTVKLSTPLQDLCDRIILQVRSQFNEIAQEINTNQVEATSKMTAIVKQMEDAKASSEQALRELHLISKQPDDLLFLKGFSRSQALVRMQSPQMNTMQVVDVEADKTMVENIDQETTDYIGSIRRHLKYTPNILSQQIKELVWSGTQWEKVQNQKNVPQIRLQKSEKMNLSFEGLTCIRHCIYTVTVLDQYKILTAKTIPNVGQGSFGRSAPQNPNFAFQSNSGFTFHTSAQNQHNLWSKGYSIPDCNCKLPVVIPSYIAKDASSSKVHCLVDVSMSDDWCVGVTNEESDRRYLQCKGQCLSFESNTSLSLGSSKINKVKMQLDFGTNLLGFYDVGHEIEIPILICKCDDVFTTPINVGFNILDGSLSLI